MEQNTKDWLEWRKSGIGASDIPIILGISPYKKPYDLFLEKTGQKEDDNKNKEFIFKKGHELEVKARAIYELMFEIEVPPALFEHEQHPHFRASLDGYNKEKQKLVEFKYVGKEDYEKKEIPVRHYPQLQWQMLVTGISSVDYVQISENPAIKVIPCAYDEAYVFNTIIPAVEKFWECVQKKEWMKIDHVLESALNLYAMRIKELNIVEKIVEDLKKEIFSLVKEEKFLYKNFKVEYVTRKGSIDYDAIPELKNVDLEKYRKKETKSRQIKVLK